MRWLCQKAQERADAFGIPGVTYSLTLGVVKNIIPAIAATNAIVAAGCVQEALKLITRASQTMNSTCMFNGKAGQYALTSAAECRPACLACSHLPRVELAAAPTDTLRALLARLRAEPALQLPAPSLSQPGALPLYQPAPQESQRARVEANLDKTLAALGISAGEELCLTDPALRGKDMVLVLKW